MSRPRPVHLVSICLLVLAALSPSLAEEGFTPAKRLGAHERPAYPSGAYLLSLEGRVTLRVSIDASGHVTQVSIKECPGPAKEWEPLRKTVSAWEFAPARQDGEAVASELDLDYEFELDWSPSLARMYARPNKEVFQTLANLFDEWKLKPQHVDDDNQLLLITNRRLRQQSFPGLEELRLPSGLPDRMTLHCFVSPAVEPARVYCNASLHQGGQKGLTGGRLERWVLDRLDERLGTPGHTIPRGYERRAALARKLAATFTDADVLPEFSTAAITKTQPKTFPELHAKTRVKPRYPARKALAGKQGRLMYETLVQEDGALVVGRMLSREPAQGFDESSRMAFLFWRYQPARLKDGPIPYLSTATISFSLR